MLVLGSWAPRTEVHLLEFLEATKKIGSSLSQDSFGKHVLIKTKGAEARFYTDGTLLIFCENEKTGRKLVSRIFEIFEEIYSRGAPAPHIFAGKIINKIHVGDVPEKGITFGEKGVKVAIVDGEAYLSLPDLELIYLLNLYLSFRKIHAFVLEAHRDIWEKVSAIRRLSSIPVGEIPEIRNKLVELRNEAMYIALRLSQMGEHLDFISELYADSFAGEKIFVELLRDQKYMENLMKITLNQLDNTIEVLKLIYDENTQEELWVMQSIFIVGALAELIALGGLVTGWSLEMLLKLGGAAVVLGSLFLWLVHKAVQGYKRKRMVKRP